MGKIRPWTRKEQIRLRVLEQSRVPRSQIARILERTPLAVQRMLFKMGLAKRRRANGELEAIVRKLWRPGLSDVDLADLIGCKNPQAVTMARKRLGLPPGLTFQDRQKLAASYRWAGRRKSDREKVTYDKDYANYSAGAALCNPRAARASDARLADDC